MTISKEAIDTLCRPIVGIENRTPLEVQDIMSDRIRSFLSTLPIAVEDIETATLKERLRAATVARKAAREALEKGFLNRIPDRVFDAVHEASSFPPNLDAADARSSTLEQKLKVATEALENIQQTRCDHDMGFDREIGPLGCSLGDKCVCVGLCTIASQALLETSALSAPSSPGKDGGQEVDGKRVERWRRASIALGSWMAAALDNDEVCEAMKADIREWFSASEPFEGMADDGPLTISYPVHEIAHNLLLAHTGSEGGSPTVNWYGLRSEIADAIAAALDKQRRLDTQPASTALVERLKERGQAFANQVRLITHLLHGQAYSTTVAELNAFDAALSASQSTSREK